MVQEKLLDFKYYYNKLPMYLRNSTTFPEHFRIWCEFLNGINDTSDDILDLVNIFDLSYLQKHKDICDDFLDKIGALYGVKRNFSVVVNVGGVSTTKYLNLTQQEFLILIKSQIIKNFFKGTNEELEQFYKDANLPIVMKTSGEATCDCYLFLGIVDGITSTSENIIDMFLSGLFTIESAGILYTYTTYDASVILQWDTSDRVWDDANGGQWTI